MDEALNKSDPNKALLESYGEQLQTLTFKESQSVYLYTMLTDWVTKLLIAELADWKVTPFGHVLCCNSEISETFGYDTDDWSFACPESLEWFGRVSWLECRVVGKTLLLKKIINFQCFWIQIPISEEFSSNLYGRKSLIFRTIGSESISGEIPLTHASLDAKG